MDVVQTIVSAVAVAAVGLLLALVGSRRFEALEAALRDQRADTAALRAEMKQDIADLRAELKAGIAEVRSDIRRLEAKLDGAVDSIRSDLTRVALAVAPGKPDDR